MANIARYNPFDETFDDLFKGFFVRPMAFENQAQTPLQIRMDVKEDDKSYIVHAEIPGVQKNDINITIDGNQVVISAEVKRQKEDKQGEKVLRSERYYGKVYRAFSLVHEVDESSAGAKYADGVLELTLPKKAVVSAKRLSVQ
ncbi:MAG TPA: Hsp20/alpha crystallin family protein [Burkholderiales bacterium]|nr:Hsp20/alpha crystallin family protein [Burkholderiales bacterium]